MCQIFIILPAAFQPHNTEYPAVSSTHPSMHTAHNILQFPFTLAFAPPSHVQELKSDPIEAYPGLLGAFPNVTLNANVSSFPLWPPDILNHVPE